MGTDYKPCMWPQRQEIVKHVGKEQAVRGERKSFNSAGHHRFSGQGGRKADDQSQGNTHITLSELFYL